MKATARAMGRTPAELEADADRIARDFADGRPYTVTVGDADADWFLDDEGGSRRRFYAPVTVKITTPGGAGPQP